MSDAPVPQAEEVAAPPSPDEVQDLRLQAAEDDHTQADWEAATAAVLRKTRRLTDDDPDSLVWQKLARRTLDGIEVTPLGTPAHLAGLDTSVRPTRQGDWDVRVVHAGDRELALAELESGASSLWVRVEPDTDVVAALDGVFVDLAPVVLDGATAAQARALASLDPLHPDTNFGATRDEDVVAFAELARDQAVRGVVVDALGIHEAGASDGQELGWALARGAQVLRLLTAAGFDPAEAFGQVEFRLAVTDEQFVGIAKLRAFRRLWARMAELSGVDEARTRIHAVTSRAMLSPWDPYVNMLRGTVAAFAAGVGGADAVTVVPFDEPAGQDTAFGRRIARNTSALLLQESHVGKVADPAGGSYAVEKLTADLAEVAWAELGRLEKDGLDSIEERIASVVARRDAEVATRRRPLTGLTEFPNLADHQPEGDDGVRRYGAAFEALRRDPAARPAFLATLGPVSAHTARATFATNLLAAGGVAVESAGVTAGVDDLVSAYDGQPVVVLAGTDTAYAEWGADAARALREAGATHVVLAGKPGERTVAEDLVDDSCAMGVDALAFLTRTREALA